MVNLWILTAGSSTLQVKLSRQSFPHLEDGHGNPLDCIPPLNSLGSGSTWISVKCCCWISTEQVYSHFMNNLPALTNYSLIQTWRVRLHQEPCERFSSHESPYLHNLTKCSLKFYLWFSPSQINTLAAALLGITLRPYFNLSLKLLAKIFIYIMLGLIPIKPFAALQTTQVDIYPDSEQWIIIRFPATFLNLTVFCQLNEKSARASKGHQALQNAIKCYFITTSYKPNMQKVRQATGKGCEFYSHCHITGIDRSLKDTSILCFKDKENKKLW